MEKFPDGKVTVPEGLALVYDHINYLKRGREFNRAEIARIAADSGKTIQAAQAYALSPSLEAVLMHFGAAAETSLAETGRIAPVDLTTWRGGATEAFDWFYNFWIYDMAEYDASGFKMTEYGLEVLGELRGQYERI